MTNALKLTVWAEAAGTDCIDCFLWSGLGQEASINQGMI